MNGTPKKKGESRTVLRFERRLAHRPEKVWRALTEESELEQWFPANVEGPRGVGAELRFVDRNGEAPAKKGLITEYDPPRVLAYTWGDETMRWELSPTSEGCLLVFTTDGGDRSRASAVASKFRACVDRMTASLLVGGWSRYVRTLAEAA